MTATIPPLEEIVLKRGNHARRGKQSVCLLEAVSWFAGKPHSDAPPCVSPVLRSYGMRLNDRLGDEDRQLLKPFIPRMIGTAGDGLDGKRQHLVEQALYGTWLPQWLRLAKLDDLAVLSESAVSLSGQERRKVLIKVRDGAWEARSAGRLKVRQAVEAELKKRGHAAAAAAADAVAAAVAAAAAVADAAAAAAAAADAAADADAAAVADAAAAAAAAADAVAGDPWGTTYNAVYTAMRKHYETSPALAEVRALAAAQTPAAIALLDDMLSVKA